MFANLSNLKKRALLSPGHDHECNACFMLPLRGPSK